jgi:hypothetical protein
MHLLLYYLLEFAYYRFSVLFPPSLKITLNDITCFVIVMLVGVLTSKFAKKMFKDNVTNDCSKETILQFLVYYS